MIGKSAIRTNFPISSAYHLQAIRMSGFDLRSLLRLVATGQQEGCQVEHRHCNEHAGNQSSLTTQLIGAAKQNASHTEVGIGIGGVHQAHIAEHRQQEQRQEGDKPSRSRRSR